MTELERESHRKFSRKLYNQKPEQKRKRREYQREYAKNNPSQIKETQKKFYKNHRSERLVSARNYLSKSCQDPVLGDVVSYNCLVQRIRNHKDLYGDIRPCDYLIHVPTIKGLDLLTQEQKKQLDI